MREFRPHIVHALTSRALRRVHAVGLPEPRPRVVFYRGRVEQPRRWVPAHRRKYFSPRVDRFHAASDAVARALLQGGVAPGRVRVVRKGFDPAWYDVPPRDVRAELRIGARVFLVATVANARRVKGVEYAIEAVKELRRQGRDVFLVVIGDDFRRPWARWRAPLDVPGVARHLGPRGDVVALLPSFDCLLHPALSEGLPRVVVEAMLRGVPVVATAVGGVPEIVRDGETGLLVPPRDATAAAQAIERLATSPQLRRALAGAARRWVCAHLTVEAAVAATLESYRELLGDCPQVCVVGAGAVSAP